MNEYRKYRRFIWLDYKGKTKTLAIGRLRIQWTVSWWIV